MSRFPQMAKQASSLEGFHQSLSGLIFHTYVFPGQSFAYVYAESMEALQNEYSKRKIGLGKGL